MLYGYKLCMLCVNSIRQGLQHASRSKRTADIFVLQLAATAEIKG